MKVEYIKYIGGMIERPSQRKKLKAHHLTESEIDDEYQKEIEEKDLMSLSGSYGSKQGGSPTQYEYVKLVAGDQFTEFEVYNRGMSMFLDETPELKRLFSLCTKLQMRFKA